MLNHTELLKLKGRAAMLSIISNTTLVVLKLAIGLAMNSVGVISEAIHSGLDLLAAIVAWFSIREAGKPADDKHHFGHGKVENVAGLVEALLIFVAGAIIMYEAIIKLRDGHFELEFAGLGAAVMAVSTLASYLVSRHLFKVARVTDSIALEADALHLRTDVYTSAGVLLGLILIKVTGLNFLDPVIAIVVSLVIMKASWDLTRATFVQILDGKLPDSEEELIHGVLASYAGRVLDYHKLRTRKSGHTRYIDLHLMLPKRMRIEEGHSVCHEVSASIKEVLPNSHVLVHMEPCETECMRCAQACSYQD